MPDHPLTEYGWTTDVPEPPENSILGRVVRVDRGSWLVATELGVDRCHPRGTLEPQDFPATGDWVAVHPEPGLGLMLDEVLPRSGAVTRLDPSGDFEQVLVANIDTLFVLHGLDRPLRVGRLERFCLLGWEAGATPVVVLTKTDLEDEDGAVVGTMEAIEAVHEVIRGIDVIPVSSTTGAGIGLLTPYLQPGSTVGLVGESGAGKSTLVNRLVGESVQDTGATREGDSKGRHTTTARELVPLQSGAVLVDTPGLRAVALSGDSEGLEQAYGDVEGLFAGCRFRDCGHDTEPGCAVTAALESGELSDQRWMSYQKLRREIAYEARKAGDREAMAEFKKWNRKLAEFQRRRRER